MITKCDRKDFTNIYDIINNAAKTYKGIIPKDMWHDPYMSEKELKNQIAEGVEFWSFKDENKIVGVMGIQFKGEATLIRHAYVRTCDRNKGIGSKLLNYLNSISFTPLLIGTWADAKWAISFYQKHKFRLLTKVETNILLQKYWAIPFRQVETSIVLASSN